MYATLIGFGGFIVAVTLVCAVAYRHADSLESWAKKHCRKSKPANR